MRKRNTMGRMEFISNTIFWALISAIWYKNILFRCVDHLSFTQSKLILWGMLTICSAAGIFLEMRSRRNGISVVVNLLIPYGIYTVLVYFKIRTGFIVTVLRIVLLISVLYTACILGRKIKNRRRYGVIVKRRIERAIASVQIIFAGGMAVIMLAFGVNIFSGSVIMRASTGKELAPPSDSQSISDNIDTVLRLQEEVWAGLSVQERLNVLQTVANIERSYLGIPNELNVGAANLREELLGSYNDNMHEIVISMDSLLNDPVYEVLDTVCHEAYHSYQHRLIDVYNDADARTRNLRIFRRISDYAEEFDDYQDGYEDFCSYYSQECESDAREYAESAVYDYYEKIQKYLEEKQSG